MCIGGAAPLRVDRPQNSGQPALEVFGQGGRGALIDGRPDEFRLGDTRKTGGFFKPDLKIGVQPDALHDESVSRYGPVCITLPGQWRGLSGDQASVPIRGAGRMSTASPSTPRSGW